MTFHVARAALVAAFVLAGATALPAIAQTKAMPEMAAPSAKPKREPTAAQMAARERMTRCSVEWKEAKAGGKVGKDAKWPKYWSECNARLKGAKV